MRLRFRILDEFAVILAIKNIITSEISNTIAEVLDMLTVKSKTEIMVEFESENNLEKFVLYLKKYMFLKVETFM